MGVPVKVRLQAYIEPLILLSFSIIYLPITLLYNPFLLLSSPSAFRAKWFENFWKVLGPKMAATETQVTHIEDLLSRAHGKVLELGPGSGDQIYHYNPGQVEKLWAAEPNAFLHPRLLEQAAEHGLGGKIVALEAGAEPGSLLPALKKANLISSSASSLPPNGVFDTIVVIKALCSAPQDQLTAILAVVQALLRPGGQFLFFEHVENNTDRLTAWYAWAVDLVWPWFMGGCRMNGKVDKAILNMGGWGDKKVTTVGGFKGYEVFRYVKGTATKK
eukprot:TRINITY_DN4570_c0_g1_i1.p1 TRINITY_DN4570_c0_g1~~TRINITY_DN4570_c0_g1_i1.p1  ORF type:complete len:294 (-),score=20.88 TRINITY_DN4570_c0_g1_i1:193-1014(-)